MFVISQTPTYKWSVSIETPVSPGKREVETFDAEFKRLPQSEIEALVDQLGDTITNRELARTVVVGWGGIVDKDKNEVSYSEEMRDRLLDIPAVANCVVKAWLESLAGAKTKN